MHENGSRAGDQRATATSKCDLTVKTKVKNKQSVWGKMAVCCGNKEKCNSNVQTRTRTYFRNHAGRVQSSRGQDNNRTTDQRCLDR